MKNKNNKRHYTNKTLVPLIHDDGGKFMDPWGQRVKVLPLEFGLTVVPAAIDGDHSYEMQEAIIEKMKGHLSRLEEAVGFVQSRIEEDEPRAELYDFAIQLYRIVGVEDEE
jgi:hypothetical protein